MRDIFDNLFIILIEPETTENIQGLVFNAIVSSYQIGIESF